MSAMFRELCSVCLRLTCAGKSCSWAYGAQPALRQLTALDRADIRRELEVRERLLAELLGGSVAHRAPRARVVLVARLGRVRELITLLAALCLLVLAGCTDEMPPPPYGMYFRAGVTADDHAQWSADAHDWNAKLGQVVFVVHPLDEPMGDACGVSIGVEERVPAGALATTWRGTCVTVVDYAPDAAIRCVTAHEEGHWLGLGHVPGTLMDEYGCEHSPEITPELVRRVKAHWGMQ